MKALYRIPVSILLLFILLLPIGLRVQAADSGSLEQTIIDSCTYGYKVDISQYALTAEELDASYTSLQASGKLPWYVDTIYTYYYNEVTNQILEFEPEILDCDQTLYEQKAAEVLEACVSEGMSDWQIALSIHDHIAANGIYDDTLSRNTGYDLLVNGTSVCAGYAALYQDLLNRAGVPCVTVTSEAMEHAWNLVCIDSKWYHVDVTWDDPSPDTFGFVSHSYFLLTDEEISAGEDPHYGWETDITCTDSRFSDAFWKELDSPVCFAGSSTVCLLRTNDWKNHISLRDNTTGEETTVYTERKPHVDIGYGEYTYLRFGLSLRDGRLYFCTLDKLLSVAPDGSDLRTEYVYDAVQQGRYLMGCFVSGDTAYLSAADHHGNAVPLTVPLSESTAHVHSYTQTVYPPTCLEPGYTESACSCGLTCQSTPVQAAGHSYVQLEGKSATFFSNGFSKEECSACGDLIQRELPQIDLTLWLTEGTPTQIFLASFFIGGITLSGCALVSGVVVISVLLQKKKSKV